MNNTLMLNHVATVFFCHILTSVTGFVKIVLVSLLVQRFLGSGIRRLSGCTRISMEKVTLWGGLLCLTSGSQTNEGVTKMFALAGNWTRDPETKYAIDYAIAWPQPQYLFIYVKHVIIIKLAYPLSLPDLFYSSFGYIDNTCYLHSASSPNKITPV